LADNNNTYTFLFEEGASNPTNLPALSTSINSQVITGTVLENLNDTISKLSGVIKDSKDKKALESVLSDEFKNLGQDIASILQKKVKSSDDPSLINIDSVLKSFTGLLDKKLMRAFDALETKGIFLSKRGRAMVSKQLETTVTSKTPTGTMHAINKLHKDVKESAKVIKGAAKVIKDVADVVQSKTDSPVTKVKKGLAVTKEGVDVYKSGKSAAKELSDSAKVVRTALRSDIDTLIQYYKKAEVAGKAQVANVREKYQKDPVALMEGLITTFSKSIQQVSPELANTDFVKAVNEFSGKIGDLDKLVKAAEVFANEANNLKTTGASVDVDALGQAVNQFSDVVYRLSAEYKQRGKGNDNSIDNILTDKMLSSAKKVSDVIEMEVTKLADGTFTATPKIKTTTKEVQSDFDSSIGQIALPVKPTLPSDAGRLLSKQLSGIKENVPVDVKPSGFKNLPHKSMFTDEDIANLTGNQKAITIKKSADVGHVVKQSGYTKKELQVADKELDGIVTMLDKILKAIISDESTSSENILYATALLKEVQERSSSIPELAKMVNREVTSTSSESRNFYEGRGGSVDTTVRYLRDFLLSYTPDQVESIRHGVAVAPSTTKVEVKASDVKVAKSTKTEAATVESKSEKQSRASFDKEKQGLPTTNDSTQHNVQPKPEYRTRQEYVHTYGDMAATAKKLYNAGLVEDGAKRIITATELNRKELNESLNTLKSFIIGNIDATLKNTETGEYKSPWRVVREREDQPISDYFKLAGGYNKKTSGKQYSFQLANVSKLVEDYNLPKQATYNIPDVIEKSKNEIKKSLLKDMKPDRLVETIGSWIKQFSKKDIEGWQGLSQGDVDELISLKGLDNSAGILPSKDLLGELYKKQATFLQRVYKSTVGEMRATDILEDEKGLVRTIAVPAAVPAITNEGVDLGANIFETQQGSSRVLPKFATYRSGFEEMYDILKGSDRFDIHKDYSTKIKELGYRPSATQRDQAEEVSKNMLRDYASSSYETREFIAKQFDAAAVIAGRREQKLGVSEDPTAVLGRVSAAKQDFGKEFAEGSVDATEKFIDAMEQAGVSAYDFVKSLERVDFENIYQVMQRILTDQPGSPSVLTNLANAPWQDKKIRDFENALGKLVGTIPIVDQARPRRYAHQEKIVNMMTMTSPIFAEEGTSKMTADDQKTFIRDLNKTLREYVADTQALTVAGVEGRKLPLDVYDISSLGVPESQAATLNEYRFGGKVAMNAEEEYEKIGELSKLNATALKMYTDDLTSLMPFGAQFQQKGRNIASTTNAYTYVPDPKMAGILGTTTPALQSQRESDLIRSGRLGEKGYGFNVTAELRNTASTFEDQILISGKLADVLTQTVKTMVAPDKLGNANLLDTLGSFAKGGNIGVSDIEEGKVLADVTKAVEPLNKLIQNILGVKEEYKGRADKALIQEVTKAVTVVRGKDLNVQLAKIIETFFDYYGRKFTTRAGSKGVAISPTGTGMELTGADIKRLYSAPVKVLSEEERAKAGIGTAIAPKSMGELASEILDARRGFLKSKVPDVGELQRRLESSGNKFMLDMFKDPNLKMVSAKEAAPQVKLFADVKEVFSKFGVNLEDGVKGIEALKDLYKAQKPGGGLFKEKTIDIRISSFGLAKRGLQPENLETIMNNIINSKGGDPTVIATEFAKETYSKFLGHEDEKLSFSKLSEALGYAKAYDTTGDKAKDLERLRSDMKDLLAARGVTEDKPGYEDKLNKLVELEKNASYYSNIFDEFGEQRKSLVGTKFVEIVENPHQYASWSSGDIQKQKKGTKLNLPAYGAYASIFGEDSAFMGQMSEEIPLDAKKHWEYMKALQSINPTNLEARQALLGAAQEVDISDIYDFQGSTGVMASREELTDIGNKRDEMTNLLNDTILDSSRFPGAVNLRIPSTSQPDERESVYIPSAIARSTYDEPTMAGHQGLDLISRRIQILASAAKKVDDLKSGKLSEGQLEDLSTGRLKKNLGDFRKKARTIASNAVSGGEDDPAVIELKNMLNRLSPALKTAVDPKMLYPSYSQYYNDPSTGETKEKSIEMYMNEFFQRQLGKGKPIASALAETIEQAVDNIIGPYEDPTSPNVKGRQLRPGAYDKSASVLGKIATREAPEQRLTGVQNLATALQFKPPTAEDRTEQLQRALKSLEKAKIEYYNTLADTALGKTGSVQEVIFSRKIPSVMAKAVNAVVDKTDEFRKFEKVLEDLSKVEMAGDSDLATALSELSNVSKEMSTKVTKKHVAAVEKHIAKGLPVLGQHELGIPEEYAKKIPAVFDKKFRMTDSGKLERVYPTEDKPYEKGRNLSELLKYREMLESNRGQLKGSPADQEAIQHILDKEVTPYIESVRFPFTGTSSVQPYKAKLLTGEMGAKAKHALMAPGLPEMDVAAFKKILASVEGVADKLVEAREVEQGEADPNQERIAKLTETINTLDQAISDVIPKYIAQQQKLDFDGDQIQVHAAKTMAARKEIEKHFKTVADFSSEDKRTTAKTFMDQFTFDALEPSTGKYILAEQQLAFEKKFPTTEGFSFLERPFLTKELDYLSPNEQLGILANQPGYSGKAQGPLNALKEVLPEVFKEQSKINEIAAELNKVVEPKDIEGKTDTNEYTNALIAKLVEMGPEVMKPVAGGMKEQLYDTKYLNAINAQLFKINTGRDTESLNRILKVFERNVGFGGGIIHGTGEYARSEKFASRFPEQLKSLAGPIEEEFSTMMNEFIRVGIQKGLDVKHAGEIPIATEMAQLLSKGPEGVDKLISKITNEEGSYKALNEFYDANKKALERNFGTVSTANLREDAFKIAAKQPEPEKAEAQLSYALKDSANVRETLEKYIIQHVGFEGFLRELSQQIEDAAREGLLRQIASWDDDYKAKKLKGRKPVQYANAILKTQLEEGGIQLRTTAEENLTPLYGFRTSGATSADQLKKFGTKHAKLQHEELATVFGDAEEWNKEKGQFTERGRYANKYRRAEAVAQNMADAFGDFSKIESTRGAGSYDKMLLSTIDNMRADQKLIHNILSTYKKESTVAGKDIVDVDIMDRLLGKEPLGYLAKNVLGTGSGLDIKNELERISRATGTAPLSKAEEDDLKFKYGTKASELGGERARVKQDRATKPWSDEKLRSVTENETKAIMDQVLAVAQLNKVIRTAETKSADSLFMSDFVPGSDSIATVEEEYKRREQQLNANRASLDKGISATIKAQSFGYDTGMSDLGTGGGGGMLPPLITPPGGLTPSVSGGIVPVHIESIKSGIGLFLGDSSRVKPSNIGPAAAGISPSYEEVRTRLDKDIARMEELTKKITGSLNVQKDSDFGKKYRASALKGGLAPEEQVKAIMKTMLGEEKSSDILSSSSFLGTAIHSKLEDVYRKEKPGTIIEQPVRYQSPVAGEVSGTIDVLRKDESGKVSEVIDIKTISDRNYKIFKEIADQLKAEKGEVTFEAFQEKLTTHPAKISDQIRFDKMGGVASQLNLYLKALESESADAFAHFYSNTADEYKDPIVIKFKYDEERLNRDMESIVEARRRIESAESPKPYAKTASFEKAKQIAEDLKKPENQVTEEEVNELLDRAKEYYKYATKKPSMYEGLPSTGVDLGDEAYKNIAKARQAMEQQAAYLNDLEKPPKPVYGAQAKFTHQALSTLHSKASDIQSERFGVSLSQTGMDKFSPKIKEELEKVLQSGPRGTKFYNLLNKLKEEDDTFSDADFTKAWKAYRVAVGDYYVQAMEDALANIGKQEQGSAAEAKAFSNYKDVVSSFQRQVKSDLGKATDIYTINRSYVDPQSAKDAGVYMNATQLASKGAGVLGEDDTLRGLLEKILDLDIHDKSTPVPRDTVGMVLKELIGLDKDLIDMYTDDTAVSRYGTTLFDSMDFKNLKQGISRLREGLEEVIGMATKDQYSSEQKAHLDEVLKQLKGLEKTYINLDLENESFVNASGENIVPTIIEPPKQLPRKWQEAIANRNVAKLEDYFATPSAEGGPLRGDVYTYDKKAFGPNNKMMQHERFDFIKSFDYFDKDQGKWLGEFDRKYKNITKTVAEGNRTFSIAIERVIKWGAAATLVYGGMNYLKESISYISDIEVAMAKLQMVMNPLSTSFSALEQSAISFAKQYGVSIEHVLDSMRVFAQQGLSQQEVLDRTKTATVAENITDLSSTDATEALTAAMRVFNTEGEGSMRFLDSWSEVESKAAIKAGDLADAIKKAASAGKNAGFTFDQLNGMVAAIGSTTRQTGKEVGTSLRFIFNRLSTEKGPKTLGQFGISTQDINTGQLRSGFDVLSDLSEQWDELTRAQKLNVAQALGGTRQYNAVLTLMDNWDETLRSVTNSINSKGSAERRNAILMKTYAKQVEQLKAAAGELKIEFGKIVLPGFKVGVTSLKTLIELFNNIPTEIKLAGAAFTAFFAYMIKGSSMIDSFFDHLNKGKAVFRDLKTEFKKGLDMSAYELFGMGDSTKNSNIMGLKTIKQGATLSELEGPFSKLGYLALSTGRDFNSFLSLVSKDTGKAANAVGSLVKSLGEGINYIGTYLGMGANLIGQPELAGMIKTGTKVASKPLEFVGEKTSGLGKYGIDVADYIKKNATGPSAGIVQSVGPMLGVAAAGGLALPQLIKIYKRLSESAEEYKNSLNDEIGATEKEQSTVRALISEYERMDKAKKKLTAKAAEGALVTEDSFGNTKGIATQLAKLEDQYTDFKNKVATSDINFVVGYTLQGDAVLKGGMEDNLAAMLRRSSGKKQFEVAGKKMDIAARFANEATQTDGIQSWKYHIKEIVKNFPLIGEKLGDAISVGPKKAMYELQKSLHKMLTAKNANPLSNAFDDAIKELQERQIELRAAIKIDAKQAKNIIDSIDTSDMSPLEINATFNKAIYDDLYELLSMSSTMYKRAGVTGGDVRGQYVLSAANPNYKNYLAPTADLTMERFRNTGLMPRIGSGETMPVKVGDILKLSETASKDLGGVSGRQAILGSERYEESGKVLTKYFLSFADAEGKYRKKFIPGIKALDGMVQAAVSLSEVSNKLTGDFASLSEMVTGASAGMSALDKKSLTKRSVSLGPKFYSDIATEVLLQTNKGYDVKTRSYTTPAYKANYADEFINNYAEKMEQWETTLASYRASDKPADTKLTGGFGEQLKELQDVLKNNSVVMQFRSALEDLSKTIEASDAALVKNIALEKRRYEVQKNLSGLMAGIPEGLENFDVGTFELKDLSASQRMLYDNRGSQELVKAFNIEKKRQDAYTSQMDAITSTMLDVQRINETSLGFSSRFTTQAEFDKYAETIRYTGGDLGSAEIVSAVDASSDLLNQSNTELIAIKTGIYEVADLLKSPEDRWSSKVEKAQIDVAKAEKGTWYSNKSVAGAMRIADLQRIQSATAAEGRSEEAALMEKDIGKLTKELISRTSVGDVVRSLTPISKDAQYKILNSAISESGYSAADIVDYMDRAAVANKDLTKRQQKSIKKGVGAYREATTKKEPSFFNTDTLGFGALGLSIFAGSSASRKNEQITELSKRMGNVQKEIATQGEKPDPKLLTELEALKRAKEGAESSAMIGATLQQLSTTGFLTYAGSKAAMGNSDAATTKLMMGAVATHTLFKSMGMDNLKKVPEFAKDFDKFIKGLGEKIGTVVKNKDPKAVEEALKKHGSKVKDRINEAAKEYFIGLKKYSEIQGKETGKTDADVAVEVENAKKMYSSNKKAQEKRAAIEEEFAVQSDAGKQFVLDLVKLETAMGLVRAAFSDAASDAKIAGMENTAEEQTKIFFDKIYSVSPKFANDIISSIVSGRDVDTLPIERGEPIKGPSTAFNVEDSINAVLAELHDQLAAVGDDYSKSSQLLAVLASATALKKRFTTLITTLETFNRSLHDSITSMELSAKYQGPSTFGDVLKGYIGDIKTAQSYSEFSPQQQLYAGGSGAFKELITDYQKGSKLMDKYVTALSNFESEVYSSEETIKSLEEKFNMLKNSGEATDGELEATAQTLSDNKKILETRRKVLKDTTTEADKLSKSMKNVQIALKAMTEFQTAFKGFQDSLANATANIFIQSEAGLKAYYDQRDKLLGGSHPEAAVPISVEDARIAESLGMTLTPGVSNQYDVERIRLEKAYVDAQVSGSSDSDLEKIATQISDLPMKRQWQVTEYEQKKENDLAAAAIQPAATLYENLEKLRFTKPDVLSTEQFTDIDRLNSIIKDNLSKAYSEKISGADRIAELEKFKADKGYFEGSKEALAIDKIISTIKPDDTMYRGANPVEIKAAYDELMSKYSKFAVNEEQQNLMTYVNEPLKGILNYVKVIAAKIAPEATAALEEAMSDREGSKKTDYKDWQFYAKADDSEKYRELLGLDRKENKSKPTDDWQFYTGKSNFSDVNSDDYRALMGLNKLEDYGFKTTDSSYGEKEVDLGFSKKSEKETKPIGMGDFGAKSNDPLFTGNFPKEYGKPLLSFESMGDGLKAAAAGTSKGAAALGNMLETLANGGDSGVSTEGALESIGGGLKATAVGTSKGLAAVISKSLAVLGNMLEALANGGGEVSTDNKFSNGGPFGGHPSSIGGHVSGPGGPREDKVAAYLSPGEFVIRAHTAQQIGYANLDHMNRKGTLPTAMAADGGLIPAFANGGFIDSITKGRGFRNVGGGMQSLIDDLEAGRLSSVKEEGLSLKGIGKQASFATGELISRLTKVPLDVFSGIEGASDYLANKGLSGALKSVSKIKDSVLNKVATEGIMGTVSGVGSSLYSSITDSLSKGGLGITTDVIGSLAGGTGVMSKFNKLTDVGNYIKAAKAASGDGKISKVRDMLSVLTNESGAIDNPAMVIKDIVSKSKPKVERKFPSLYDRFSPMKKDPKRKGGYNRDMLAIDKFNREYTDKYGVDFGFSRENFLPRQFLPDMGKTIDSYMERYPELKDHLSFVGSTEFTQNMPVDDALRLAAEVGDPLHNRGRHTVIPTRQGPAGVVQISNENAIKKHFVKAQKGNIPLQSVAGDVKDDLLYTLGHELSHGINRASKNKIQMAEINAVLDKLPGDVFESTYISSKKVGDPARAKERFADFGAKFEKIMADPNRKDNPTMFDMSPEDAVAEVYGYDTRLTSWGDDMVSNLFPDMKFANGGAVGGYVLDPERYLDNKRLDMAKAIYEEEHRKVREAGNSKTSSWLEEFNKKSAQFKKEQWEGRAAEEVDPKKVRSFTNIGPGGDILSEIVETTGKSYDPSRTISGIDEAINNPIYEKSWSAQDITDYLNNSISSDNNMRRGEAHLPHKWGYDTAAAAQSNVMADAKSKADDRLLKAMLSDAAFKTNTEQILSTRRGLEKDLAKHIKDKGSIVGIEESMKYGDYAFDPYRGVHKFTTNVGGRDVSAGVIEQSSYRYANKAYRPTNIKPSKKAFPHSNMWTKTYKDLIPQEEFGMDFSRKTPKRGSVDSVALKYYKDAKFIDQRIKDLFEKLHDKNLDPKDRLNYIKQLDFQSKAMSAYSNFDEVMREGGNPFTDPRLVEETTKRVPNRLVIKSLAGVEGVEPIKSEDGKEIIGFKLPSGKTISAYEQVTEKRSLLKLIEKAGNKAYIDMYKRKPLSAGSVTKASVEAETLSKSWFDKQNHGSAVSNRYTTGNSGAFGKLKEYGTVKDTDSNYFGGNTSVPDMVNSMLENFYKSRKKSDWENVLGFEDWLQGYNTGGVSELGGHVPGVGSRGDDRYPALLSQGEYVIKTDSAQKLGYANLAYMNKKGAIPAFADGGTLGNVPTTTPSTNFTNTSANLSLNVPKIELDVSEAISELRSVVLRVDKTPVKVDTKSVELPAVNIDSRELLSELRKIELRLEDKLIQVDTKSLENIKLKVDDSPVKLDTKSLENIKLKVDDSPVKLDTESLENIVLKVEDKKVELASNIIKAEVDIDVGEAAISLGAAITKAIKSSSVKVDTPPSVASGQGVGAERVDLLAATIDAMDKRLINTTTKIEAEVKELEVNLESKLSKDLDVRLASKLSGIQDDVGSLSISMTSFSDNVTSQISRVSMKALEAERLAKQALDFRNLN